MIGKMLRQFAEEVAGAREYAGCAERHPELAQMYRTMAGAEAEHAKMLAQAIDAECSKERDGEEAAKCLAGVMADIREMTAEELRGIQQL